MKIRRTRRKADNTLEIEVDCPRCNAFGKCGINLQKKVWSCWVCLACGGVPSSWEEELNSSLPLLLPSESGQYVAPTNTDLPKVALWEIERRGFDPNWLVTRYGVRWDGDRLAWPAGEGWVRRSVMQGISPKCLTVAPRGLIGQHLLQEGISVVLVEGDFKAASIPLPWVGIGVNGLILTDQQVTDLQFSRPRDITILTDGGYTTQGWVMAGQLAPNVVCVKELPKDKGPDDIPRSELVQLLLEE